MSEGRILVVDDEPQIQRFLKPALTAAGYEPLQALTAAEAERLAATAAPDLMILDLGLPDKDGKDVIRSLRAWSQAADRRALRPRPGGREDRGARPRRRRLCGKAVRHRRAARPHPHRAAPPRARDAVDAPAIEADGLAIDLAKRLVTRDGEPVHLTPKEYDLLAHMARHAGLVMTHRQLLSAVWGPAHVEDVHYLRVFVGQLRGKIERDAASPRFIRTEPGVGYRFAE